MDQAFLENDTVIGLTTGSWYGIYMLCKKAIK